MTCYQVGETVGLTVPVLVPNRRDYGQVSTLSRLEQPYTFRTIGGEKVFVCSADFSHVRRYRDFCQVEAVVHVVFQVQPSFQLFTTTVLTQVPIAVASAKGTHRQRLARKAINLYLMMAKSDVEDFKLTA